MSSPPLHYCLTKGQASRELWGYKNVILKAGRVILGSAMGWSADTGGKVPCVSLCVPVKCLAQQLRSCLLPLWWTAESVYGDSVLVFGDLPWQDGTKPHSATTAVVPSELSIFPKSCLETDQPKMLHFWHRLHCFPSTFLSQKNWENHLKFSLSACK